MDKELIVKKEALFPKAVCFATLGKVRQVIKESNRSDGSEHAAFVLMEEIGVSQHFAEVRPPTRVAGRTVTIIEYIDEDVGSLLAALPEHKHPAFWHKIFGQLASVVRVLENLEIQHNDFTPANLRVACDPAEEFNIKIIDLETMVDCKQRRVYPHEIIDAPQSEMERVGWSRSFHLGSDLNQMLGELLRLYSRFIPDMLGRALSERVIEHVHVKEFPFAISGSNSKTSGEAILKVLSQYKWPVLTFWRVPRIWLPR